MPSQTRWGGGLVVLAVAALVLCVGCDRAIPTPPGLESTKLRDMEHDPAVQLAAVPGALRVERLPEGQES